MSFICHCQAIFTLQHGTLIVYDIYAYSLKSNFLARRQLVRFKNCNHICDHSIIWSNCSICCDTICQDRKTVSWPSIAGPPTFPAFCGELVEHFLCWRFFSWYGVAQAQSALVNLDLPCKLWADPPSSSPCFSAANPRATTLSFCQKTDHIDSAEAQRPTQGQA